MTQDAHEEIANALRALATAAKNPSQAARLRDVFDSVETALRAGVRRKTVLEELHKHGFAMRLGGFKSALQRIRKERAKIGVVSAPRMEQSLPQRPSRTPEVQLARPSTAGITQMEPNAVAQETASSPLGPKPIVERPRTFTRTKTELNLDE
jgi:hypothetical protein